MKLLYKLLIKLRLRLSKWTYRELNLETKFDIGDIVVTTYNESYSPFEDGGISGRGEIVDIYMGSRMHSNKDWYYTVVFTDDTVIPPYNKVKADFNHWEIKLDKSYIRDKKLKELGL
jgi:hypothetical protein